MSMKNSNGTIENRSRDLLVYSAVPQPLRHRVPPIIRIYLWILFMCMYVHVCMYVCIQAMNSQVLLGYCKHKITWLTREIYVHLCCNLTAVNGRPVQLNIPTLTELNYIRDYKVLRREICSLTVTFLTKTRKLRFPITPCRNMHKCRQYKQCKQ
jgi:hypothetical protein